MRIIRSMGRVGVNLGLRWWGARVSREHSASQNIVLAGYGRSGSTWLAELLGMNPGYPLLWEPLHLGSNPSCVRYGFDWNTFVPVGAHEPRLREYFEGLFSGAGLSVEVVSSAHFHPMEFLRFRGFLIKFINANLLLPWLVREFPLRTVLLIRHPCDVVASQLRHSAWDHLSKENLTFSRRLQKAFPHFVECFERLQHREEILAFEWACHMFVPLTSSRPHSWHLVSYESLVSEGLVQMHTLLDYLALPVRPRIGKASRYRKLDQSSRLPYSSRWNRARTVA